MERKLVYITLAFGLILLLSPLSTSEEFVKRTDEAGRAVFSLPPGRYKVIAPAELEGYPFSHWVDMFHVVEIRYPEPNIVGVNVKRDAYLIACYSSVPKGELPPPTALSPVGVLDTRQVVFKWTSVLHATSYEISVTNLQTMEENRFTSVTIPLVIDNFPFGEFIWCVRAIDGVLYYPSKWSNKLWFKVPENENRWYLGIATFDTTRENVLDLGVMIDIHTFKTPFVAQTNFPRVVALLLDGKEWGYIPARREVDYTILSIIGAVGFVCFIISALTYVRFRFVAIIAIVAFVIALLVLLPRLIRVIPRNIYGTEFYKWDIEETGTSVELSPRVPAATAYFDKDGKTKAIVVLAYDAAVGKLSQVSVTLNYSPIGKAPVGKVVKPGVHRIEVPKINEFGSSFSFWIDGVTNTVRDAEPGTYVAIYGDKRIPREPVIVLSGAALPKHPAKPVDYTLFMAVCGTISIGLATLAIYRWKIGI